MSHQIHSQNGKDETTKKKQAIIEYDLRRANCRPRIATHRNLYCPVFRPCESFANGSSTEPTKLWHWTVATLTGISILFQHIPNLFILYPQSAVINSNANKCSMLSDSVGRNCQEERWRCRRHMLIGKWMRAPVSELYWFFVFVFYLSSKPYNKCEWRDSGARLEWAVCFVRANRCGLCGGCICVCYFMDWQLLWVKRLLLDYAVISYSEDSNIIYLYQCRLSPSIWKTIPSPMTMTLTLDISVSEFWILWVSLRPAIRIFSSNFRWENCV